jgi:hypothetical protein
MPLAPQVQAVTKAFARRIRRDEGHRYRVKCADGAWRAAPSVTRVLGTLGKPALIGWAARSQHTVDLEAAWTLYDTLPRGFPRWKFEALFQAEAGEMKAHERLLKNANDHGAQVHTAIETSLRGDDVAALEITEAARAGFALWQEWWATTNLTPLSIEGAVTYFEGKAPVFAGTYDLLAERQDGSLVLIDWKTSSSVGHVEQRLQNVAYRTALRQMGIEAPIEGLLVRIPKCGISKIETYDVKDPADAAFSCFRALVTVHAWSARAS